MRRYMALDSLRGLAALSVFFAHVHSVFWQHHVTADLTPIFLFWAGGEAVILFFVLSGFVLTKSTQVETPLTFFQFLTGRILRIGVPNLVMLGGCTLAVMASETIVLPRPSGFQWPQKIDFQLLASHALMVSDFNNMILNDVVWTLSHEMRFALLFPAFIFAISKIQPSHSMGLFAGLSMVAAMYVTSMGDPSSGFKTAYVYTLHYLLMFAMGGVLLLNFEKLSHRFSRLSPTSRWLWIAAALMVYCYARLIYLVPQKLGWSHLAVFNAFVADALVAGAACTLILATLVDPSLKSWLEMKPLQYLGKVSFSLYLVHIPVLKICFYAMPEASKLTVVIVATPLVALTTHAFYKAIESPAQKLSRSMVQRWARNSPRTQHAQSHQLDDAKVVKFN